MYDELVKTLQNMSKMGTMYGMAAVKMREAADAIEFLNNYVEELKRDAEEVKKKLYYQDVTIAQILGQYLPLFEPRWISASEWKPDEKVPVQVTYLGCTDKQPRSDMLACIYYGKWCYWDGEPCSYEECRVEITHWRPLPKPPEEET